MKHPGATEWETTLDLPLGAIGEQIRRVETQLRAIQIAATGAPDGRLPIGAGRVLAARLESLRATVSVIDTLIHDLETHLAPEYPMGHVSDDHGKSVRPAKSARYDD